MLDISRLFLAAHGHLSIVVATVITVSILCGAALLSTAEELRSSGRVLLTAGFLAALLSAGWITLGHSQPSPVSAPTTLPSTLRTNQTRKVTAAPGGNLAFAPNSIDVRTGLVKFKVLDASPGHTFGFHEASTMFRQLSLDTAGSTYAGVAFFANPGDYIFFCSIPGHEAAGMRGVVHASGPSMTLQHALAASGNG